MNNRNILQFFMMAVIMMVAVLSTTAQNLQPQQDEKTGTWGYVNNSGKWVVKAKYAVAEPFQDGVARVEKDGAIGFVNTDGKEVLRCKYGYAGGSESGPDRLIIAQEKEDPDKWILYAVKDGSKLNYVTTKKHRTEKGAYFLSGNLEGVGFFSSSTPAQCAYIVLDNGGRITMFEQEGSFKEVGPYWAFAPKNRKDGYKLFSDEGQYLADDVVNVSSSDGYGWFKTKDGKAYLISPDRTMLYMEDCTGNNYWPLYLGVKNDGSAIYFEKENNVWKTLDTFEYVVREKNNNGFIVFNDGKWGFLGKLDLGGIYGIKRLFYLAAGSKDKIPDWTYDNYNNVIMTSNGQGKKGVMSLDGEDLLVCEYDSIRYVGMEAVTSTLCAYKNGKALLYDIQNKKIVMPLGAYSNLEFYGNKNELFVYKGDKKGLLSWATGTEIVPCRYHSISKLAQVGAGDDVVYTVSYDGKKFGLFYKGKEIVSPNMGYSYDYDNYPTNIIGIIVKKNGKVGVVNYSGQVVVPVIYDSYLNGVRNCMFTQNKDGGANYFIYNSKGKVVKSGYMRNSDTLGIRALTRDYLM